MSVSKKLPKVSIGLPVYNGGLFLRGALDSLLQQSFSDFELIISDNASTDDTEIICREYAKKEGRIRYIRQPENQGAMANFKFVLDEAVGEYFMWAAADDRRTEKFLEYAVEVLDSDDKTGLVFSDMVTENLTTGEKVWSSRGFIVSNNKFIKYIFRLFQECPSLIYGVHRKEVLQNIKLENFDYFDVHLTHWYELNLNIKTIPLPLYTAGTNGVRVPYSSNGHYICSSQFIRAEKLLLAKHFSFFSRFFLL
jgi:glycosyltransferase involved in cell wall biosynthesis